MRRVVFPVVLAMTLGAAGGIPTDAADDSRVKAATRQVERGAKKVGEGKLGEGAEETAKGIGNTVAEGARYTGEKLKESGKAAEPEAKTAWRHARDGAVAFGRSVKNFFTNLVGR